MFYKIAVAFCRICLLFAFRIKAVGQDNIPKEGGCILALNHKSNLDPVIAAVTCKRKPGFMAKAELFENKFFGALIKSLGAFPVQRGKGDIGAIKCALSMLKEESMILMFPEGKRVKKPEDEKFTKAKPGAVMIAIRARVPIQPAYISGKYSFMKKITVKYGEPIYFDEYYDKKLTVEELQNITDEVMKNIRSLKV